MFQPATLTQRKQWDIYISFIWIPGWGKHWLQGIIQHWLISERARDPQMFPSFILSKRSAHHFIFYSMQFLSHGVLRLSICPEKSLSTLSKWSNSSNGCFPFEKPTNQNKKTFFLFAFESYLISFSSLMRSILKWFYLQEDFKVF